MSSSNCLGQPKPKKDFRHPLSYTSQTVAAWGFPVLTWTKGCCYWQMLGRHPCKTALELDPWQQSHPFSLRHAFSWVQVLLHLPQPLSWCAPESKKIAAWWSANDTWMTMGCGTAGAAWATGASTGWRFLIFNACLLSINVVLPSFTTL